MGGIQGCLLSEDAFQEKDPGAEVLASLGPRPVAKTENRDRARKAVGSSQFHWEVLRHLCIVNCPVLAEMKILEQGLS